MGRFTFCQVSFGNNGREVYTNSPLYLEEGHFFLAISLWLLMVHLGAMVLGFRSSDWERRIARRGTWIDPPMMVRRAY